MSVIATYKSVVDAQETLSDASLSSDAKVMHDAYSTTKLLNASTSVPASKVAAFSQALSTGTATIDLTSLTGLNGASVDGTGLKVQLIKFINPSGNSTMEIDVGASNGYELLGSGMEIHLLAGQEILIYGNDATPDIASDAKTIDLVGTGSEELQCIIVMG